MVFTGREGFGAHEPCLEADALVGVAGEVGGGVEGVWWGRNGWRRDYGVRFFLISL